MCKESVIFYCKIYEIQQQQQVVPSVLNLVMIGDSSSKGFNWLGKVSKWQMPGRGDKLISSVKSLMTDTGGGGESNWGEMVGVRG